MMKTYTEFIHEKREFDKMPKVKDKKVKEKIIKTIKSINPEDPKVADHLMAVRKMINSWHKKFGDNYGTEIRIGMRYGLIPSLFKQEWEKKKHEVKLKNPEGFKATAW